MNTFARIQRSVANSGQDVFLRQEFERFGSPAHISRTLRELANQGLLVKLGIGVYAKAKRSVLSGKSIPLKPLEVLAPEVLRKLGISVQPSRLAQAYNDGKSTQVPAGVVLNIGRQRVTRKIGFNGKTVQFEQA